MRVRLPRSAPARRVRRPTAWTVLAVTAGLLAASCSYETQEFSFDVAELVTAQSSRVYDRNGTLITELRGEQNRTDVQRLEDIPEVVRDAVVAIEDERFWDHNGIDLKGIIRAARSNVSAGGISQGASTITQQYVGNVFLDRSEKTANRKVEELFMAMRFEQQFSKEFILLHYLNWVYFGNGAYGVEAAARQYFGAPSCARATRASDPDDRDCLKVSELTLPQAALIAGLIQAPAVLDPYRHPDRAVERRNLVLDRMLANGYITQEEHDEAVDTPLELVENVTVLDQEYPAAYFVEDVKQWFLDNPRFGATREERARLLFEGGLDIYTTVDLDLQAKAEAAVEAILPDNGHNPDAAAVVIGTTPADDGQVLAMVGGRDFFGDDEDAKFNLASGKGRQAGSSMKPIALATALSMGIPITEVYDAPKVLEVPPPNCGPRTWKVRGGAGVDEETGEPLQVTLAEGTRRSLNVVYAQVIQQIGPQNFVDMAERLGIGEDRISPVCAAVLGTEDVNVLELATVYSTFAREGIRVDPIMVTRILDRDGTPIYEATIDRVPVLEKRVAAQIDWALSRVIAAGTGTAAQFGRPAAGKTGTAQNFADATFAGYTPQRAAAVWVGFPEEQIPMVPPTTDIRVFGGTYPAKIWREIMIAAHEGLPEAEFPTPPPSSTTTTEPPLPDSVVVPDLVGRTVDDALVAELDEMSLVLATAEVETNEFPPGTIVNQAPVAGAQAPGGSTITVEVAVAPPEPETVVLGSVVGLTEAEARQTLTADGLGVVTEVAPDPDPPDGGPEPGVVWAQDPGAGTTVEVGSTVVIRVNPTP